MTFCHCVTKNLMKRKQKSNIKTGNFLGRPILIWFVLDRTPNPVRLSGLKADWGTLCSEIHVL